MGTLGDYLKVLRRLAPLHDECKKMQVVWEGIATKLPLETPYLKVLAMEDRLNRLNFMFSGKTITVDELLELGVLQSLMIPGEQSEKFLVWARHMFSVYQPHVVVAEVVPLT
jgi:hypothetical protein